MKGAALQIKEYIKENGGWVGKNDLCRKEFRTKKGGIYGADLIARTVRSMQEQSIVAVKYIDGTSYYKYIPDYVRHLYIPTLQRKDEEVRWTDEVELNRLINYYGRKS